MSADSNTVPVTVTVGHPVHPPAAHHPPTALPFTGSPLDLLTALGLALAIAGSAFVTVVRRRSPRPSTRRTA